MAIYGPGCHPQNIIYTIYWRENFASMLVLRYVVKIGTRAVCVASTNVNLTKYVYCILE